jgi:hypothetical protein
MDCAIDWGTVPQWITAVGVGIAIWGIWSQRSIARKRAAIDVFIKTEMDEKMTEAYDKFHAGLDKMRNAKSVEEFCTAEALRPDYLAIRKYLNVHELVSVGIRKKVLDETVCNAYWADALTNGYRDAKPVLDYVRNRPRNKYTYSDLEQMNSKWLQQMKRKAG